MAKAKKKTDWKEMSETDLQNRVSDMQNELIAARQKLRLGQFKKSSEFSRLRKEIARAKTFMRQRELAAQTQKASA